LDAPVPKRPNGTPDLSGIWRAEPGGYLDNIAVDLKPGETLPWAEAIFKQRSEQFGIGHPIYRCMPEPGPLTSFGVFKVLQTAGTIGILAESGTYELVPDSNTVFYITGQRLEFFLDASGWPTHFVFTIVEGDMKAVRK